MLTAEQVDRLRPDAEQRWYRWRVRLPDGRELSGVVAEQERPRGTRGPVHLLRQHATMQVVLEHLSARLPAVQEMRRAAVQLLPVEG